MSSSIRGKDGRTVGLAQQGSQYGVRLECFACGAQFNAEMVEEARNHMCSEVIPK